MTHATLLLLLLWFPLRESVPSVRVAMGGPNAMFDGRYDYDKHFSRYTREAVDVDTGYTEFIERGGDGSWQLRSLSNDLEHGTRQITIASASNLHGDVWTVHELPQPNNKWVVTIEGDSGSILAKTASWAAHDNRTAAVLKLHRAPTASDSEHALKTAIAFAFLRAEHATTRPCHKTFVCVYPNSEIYGEYARLGAFAFSDTSEVARRIQTALQEAGLLKHLDSDVFGSSSGWTVDFLHAVPAGSPPLQVPFTGAGTYVFLLDTGIRHTHESVVGRVSDQHSKNYLDSTQTPWDDSGHGTHVASVVASVAPNATLVSSKVMNSQGLVHGHTLLAAVDDILTKRVPSIRSVDSGAGFVLSMSLSFSTRWMPIESAIDVAWDNGVATVAAAGNDVVDVCQGGDRSPQAAQRAIGVANLQQATHPQLAPSSNFGSCPRLPASNRTLWNKWCSMPMPWEFSNLADAEARCYSESAVLTCHGVYNRQCRTQEQQAKFKLCLTAPIDSSIGSCVVEVPRVKSIDVRGAYHTHDAAYRFMTGTSMSTPLVAGVLALLMEQGNALDLEALVRTRLLRDSCRANATVLRSDGSLESSEACVLSLRARHVANYSSAATVHRTPRTTVDAPAAPQAREDTLLWVFAGIGIVVLSIVGRNGCTAPQSSHELYVTYTNPHRPLSSVPRTMLSSYRLDP